MGQPLQAALIFGWGRTQAEVRSARIVATVMKRCSRAASNVGCNVEERRFSAALRCQERSELQRPPSPHDLLIKRDRPGAAGRTLGSVAQLANVNLQLGDGAAESVAVHAQFAGGAALVAFIFLKNG